MASSDLFRLQPSAAVEGGGRNSAAIYVAHIPIGVDPTHAHICRVDRLHHAAIGLWVRRANAFHTIWINTLALTVDVYTDLALRAFDI